MILQDTVLVTLNPSNIPYYEGLSYFIHRRLDQYNRLCVQEGTTIIVKVKDLPKRSKARIVCKCDKCGKERIISYGDYRSLCSDCQWKRKGQEHPNWKGGPPHCQECGKELKGYNAKICKSCKDISLTGDKHPSWNPNKSELAKYKSHVRVLTKHNQKLLFQNWNGNDYYTGEKLVTNEEYKQLYPNLNPSTNKLQPTIDHKTPVVYGFENNIDPKVIASLENLCITSRYNNTSKHRRTEQEYKKLHQ